MSLLFYSSLFLCIICSFYNRFGKNFGLVILSTATLISFIQLYFNKNLVFPKAVKFYFSFTVVTICIMLAVMWAQGSTFKQYLAFSDDFYEYLVIFLLITCCLSLKEVYLAKRFLIFFLTLTCFIIFSSSVFEVTIGRNFIRELQGTNYKHLYYRATGFYRNPIPFSHITGYLTVLLALLLPILKFSKKSYKFCYFTCLICLSSMTILSQTRASILALIIIFCCASMSVFSNYRKTILGFLVAFPLLISFSPTLRRGVKFSSFKGYSINYRLHTWKAHLRATAEHPWLGIGYDKFWDQNFMKKYHYDSPQILFDRNHFSDTHNHFIEVLTCFGIPTFILYLLFYLYPLLLFLKSSFQSKSKFKKVFLFSLAMSLLFLTIVISFDRKTSTALLLQGISIALGYKLIYMKGKKYLEI